MVDIFEILLKEPTLISVLIALVGFLLFGIWQIVKTKFNVGNESYDEVINVRAKLLMDSLTSRIETQDERLKELENTVSELVKDLNIERDENLRLAMLNALLVNSKSLIRNIPTWLFSYPEFKAVFISEECSVFFEPNTNVMDYINDSSDNIWNNANSKLAAKHGFWCGFEALYYNSTEITYDWFVIKVGVKDDSGVVKSIYGMALELKSNVVKSYLKSLVESINDVN